MRVAGANASRIRTIIFDLDGVMVIPWGFANYLETQGITREMTREFFTGILDECMCDIRRSI